MQKSVRRRCPLCSIGALLLLVCSQVLDAAPLGIAVAANFRQPMEAIAHDFEREFATEVRVTVSSSGKLYAQILQGAPFDVFFSADAAKPQRLEQARRTVPGTRFIYARGALVLWSASAEPRQSSADIAAAILGDTSKKIAMANPTLAPYGLAAQQSLRHLNLYEAVQGRLVYGENISQVMNFAAAGGIGWAFLAFSQVQDMPANQYWRLPQNSHAPIIQEAVMLKNSKMAAEFMAFFKSQKVTQMIKAHGYLVADKPSGV